MSERDENQPAVVEHGVVRITRTVPLPTRPTPPRQHPAIRTARGVGAMLYQFLDTTPGAALLFAIMCAIVCFAGLYAEGHSL